MDWDSNSFRRELATAVEAYDRPAATDLCDRLISHLRHERRPYPVREARIVLRLLRRKRLFGVMINVAEALLQSGQRSPPIRCEYAQALIDRGLPAAAREMLDGVLRETTDQSCRAEARGLLGRAYKQMYVDSAGSHSELLQKAVETYGAAFDEDPARCAWHGINAAALLRHASREGSDVKWSAPCHHIARRVRADIERQSLDPDVATGPWDAALAAEACLILDDNEDALQWMQRYAGDGRVDAFELASTLRQMTDIWQLTMDVEPGRRVLPILRAQMLVREQGARLELSSADLAAEPADESFEKVLGDAGVVTYSWYRRGLARSRAVAQISHRCGRAVGTGFLLRAGDLEPEWLNLGVVLVTNSHVLSPHPESDDMLAPEQAQVELQALAMEGKNRARIEVKEVVWSSPPDELDATVARLVESPRDVDPCPITPYRPRLDGKQRVYVIGHPEGRELSYSIDDNILLDYDDRFIHYRAPTEPGSSGSPVFNRDWEVIGLHHAGRNDMRQLHGRSVTYPANEGIWIEAIRKAISTKT